MIESISAIFGEIIKYCSLSLYLAYKSKPSFPFSILSIFLEMMSLFFIKLIVQSTKKECDLFSIMEFLERLFIKLAVIDYIENYNILINSPTNAPAVAYWNGLVESILDNKFSEV